MTMNNESGRSMVEMLGVLAIIGVLSIGGIAGYTMAMNRYRANEIIDAAAKVAVIAMTKTDGSNANLADIGYDNETLAGLEGITADSTGLATIDYDEGSSDIIDTVQKIVGTKKTSNGTVINFAN